jgi:hypothetical protein
MKKDRRSNDEQAIRAPRRQTRAGSTLRSPNGRYLSGGFLKCGSAMRILHSSASKPFWRRLNSCHLAKAKAPANLGNNTHFNEEIRHHQVVRSSASRGVSGPGAVIQSPTGRARNSAWRSSASASSRTTICKSKTDLRFAPGHKRTWRQ